MKIKLDIDGLLLAAKNKVDKCRIEWHEAKLELVKMLDECRETHTLLPNNYWQKEHRLLAKYMLALQLLRSFQEIKDEENEKLEDNRRS